MQAIGELAEAEGIPWPRDPDAEEEEMIEQSTRLMVAKFGREIERALEVGAK